MKIPLQLSLWLMVFCLNGCAAISEPFKRIWGSSTEVLEKQRVNNALSQTFKCSFTQCYEAVLELAKEAEYEIFIEDRLKRHVILIGIKGSVNTTEAGIFFAEHQDGTTTIDITSLSSIAKETVSENIFSGLAAQFRNPT